MITNINLLLVGHAYEHPTLPEKNRGEIKSDFRCFTKMMGAKMESFESKICRQIRDFVSVPVSSTTLSLK